MKSETKVWCFVVIICALAVVGGYVAWILDYQTSITNPPDLIGVAVLILAGLLLEASSIRLRGGDADGSIAFVIHISAGVLFGIVWALPVVGLSTVFGQVIKHNKPIKIVFNTAQHALSLVVAFSVYYSIGGEIQPQYLISGGNRDSVYVLSQLFALLLSVLAYIAVNSFSVSTVVALSTNRSIATVWKTNTLWVLVYDLVATVPAIFVCYLYLRFDTANPWDRVWFLGIIAGLAFVRHIYVKLNLVQTLSDQRNKALAQLEQNVRDVLTLMVRSIEARDPYTSGHSRRVGALARTLAIEFGLPSGDVEAVENAALLHDVGKIHAQMGSLVIKFPSAHES